MSSSVVSLRNAAGAGAPAAAPAASAALRTVYVGKISCSVSPQRMVQVFQEYGAVESARS